MSTKLILYCRVSTEEQAEHGVSMDAQEAQLRAYVAAHSLEALDVVRDNGVSARTLARRDGLQRALAVLRAGDADGLVVTKLDRLSRSLRDVLDLAEDAHRRGWQLHILDLRVDTGTPTGRAVLSMMAVLAQMERELAGERTKAALDHRRRKGLRVSGRPPFGYRFDGDRVVEVAVEQEALDLVMGLRSDGLGPKRVARELASLGNVNPRTGKPWTPSTLQSIIATAERRAKR